VSDADVASRLVGIAVRLDDLALNLACLGENWDNVGLTTIRLDDISSLQSIH
jgi:hypothetical protein